MCERACDCKEVRREGGAGGRQGGCVATVVWGAEGEGDERREEESGARRGVCGDAEAGGAALGGALGGAWYGAYEVEGPVGSRCAGKCGYAYRGWRGCVYVCACACVCAGNSGGAVSSAPGRHTRSCRAEKCCGMVRTHV